MYLCSCLVKQSLPFFSPRRDPGDTVTQREGPVTLPEGTPLTLNCTYERSYSVSAFWYGQHQNKEPELPLKSSSENQRAERQGFQAHRKSDKSFPLGKRGAQTSDWALYYCPLGMLGDLLKVT
uniref:Ig-like domain-containing protein n=1 Tax=Ursus americanus TaxID=9643 RepID=A0A452QDP9_URSAM